MIFNPIMQPDSNEAARTSRLDSDEEREITFWQPGGERNSNWCKVPNNPSPESAPVARMKMVSGVRSHSGLRCGLLRFTECSSLEQNETVRKLDRN